MTNFKQYRHLKVNTAEGDIKISVGKSSSKANPEVFLGDESYYPTTLEDIESTKMSSTQICVIAVSLIAILLFILWYVLLR